MTCTVGWKKRKEFEGSDIVCIVVEAESRGAEHIFFYGDPETLVNRRPPLKMCPAIPHLLRQQASLTQHEAEFLFFGCQGIFMSLMC
jgi:hypothetical protein